MNKFYKRFLWSLLILVIISVGIIGCTIDVNTLNNLTKFELWSLVLAVCSLSLGLFFDGTRLMHLVRISNEQITIKEIVYVVFGNYFLALITPGATGGAVAQVLFLRYARVPTGKAAVLVIVRTLVSIVFLLLLMPLIFAYDDGIVPWFSHNIILVTTAIILMFLTLFWFLKHNLLRYIVLKLALKFNHERRHKLYSFYRDIRGAILLLYTEPWAMFGVFVESGVSLLFIYSVVPILFWGMGVNADLLTVMGRMMFLNILLYFAPTPGGSGIAEGGFVYLFSEFLPAGTVGVVAVVWRMLVEYLPFIIGLYFTLRVLGRDFISRYLTK